MLSDVLGIQLQTPSVTIGASYGDALMAMIGVNHIKDFPEAKKLIGAGKVYDPNLENTRQYEPYYNVYIELYKQNKDLMVMMDQIYEHYQKWHSKIGWASKIDWKEGRDKQRSLALM